MEENLSRERFGSLIRLDQYVIFSNDYFIDSCTPVMLRHNPKCYDEKQPKNCILCLFYFSLHNFYTSQNNSLFTNMILALKSTNILNSSTESKPRWNSSIHFLSPVHNRLTHWPASMHFHLQTKSLCSVGTWKLHNQTSFSWNWNLFCCKAMPVPPLAEIKPSKRVEKCFPPPYIWLKPTHLAPIRWNLKKRKRF